MLIDVAFCVANKACFERDELEELFPVPLTLRQVLTKNDGPWLRLPIEHRFWVATRPGVLSATLTREWLALSLHRLFIAADFTNSPSYGIVAHLRNPTYTEEDSRQLHAVLYRMDRDAAARVLGDDHLIIIGDLCYRTLYAAGVSAERTPSPKLVLHEISRIAFTRARVEVAKIKQDVDEFKDRYIIADFCREECRRQVDDLLSLLPPD